MSRKILSIDIRDDGIFALLVENSIKGNRISAQRFAAYADTIDDPEHGGGHDISRTLAEVIQDMHVSGTEPIVSISAEFVSYRNLQVPFKDRKKIRQVLPFELEPTLPYPVDEVTMDFETIQQAGKTDILVGVVKTSEIRKILEALKELHIEPFIIAPGGFSSVVCLSKFIEPDKDFIFIDLDEKYITVFTVKSGYVYSARSFYSPISDPRLKAGKLCNQIMQVIASFESLFATDFEPVRLFLSGNSAGSGVLVQTIEETLSVPASFVDMFAVVNPSLTILSELPLDASRSNNALALAAIEIAGLRTINFSEERSIVKKYWEEYKNEFIRTGLLAAFVFVLVMFNVLFKAHFLQKDVNALNRQIAFIFQSTFPDVEKIDDPFAQMKARMAQEREKNAFTGDMATEILNIDILNEISSRIPDQQDVELTSFVRGDESLIISGDTDSFNNVDDIKNRLESPGIFKNITISSANLEKSTNRIQFKLKIDL